MKPYFPTLLFLLFFSAGRSQDTTRILFIGNSFTYYNNMPQMVKALADSADLPVVIGMHAPGGISVGDTAQGTMAHWKNPALFQLIRSKKWDFAVIQDNQGRFVRDSAVFSGASKVVQGHLNIMDSIKKNNDCAKIILFGGWAWKFGMPPYGNTGIETIDRIMVNYCVLNDTMKEMIAPIGEAWIKAFSYMPATNLWDVDDAHPSYAGSYLTASVIFSSIFDLPAKTLNYNGTIIPATAYNLRAYADSSVFGTNFHTRFNLGGVKKISPQYSNGALSLAGNYASYKWFKNSVFIGTTPQINTSGNGDYRAEIEEHDGCIVKSCSFSEFATGLSEAELVGVRVFPNPVSGAKLTIRSEGSWDRIELYSVSGLQQKVTIEHSAGESNISTKALKPGCYTLLLGVKDRLLYKKIVILE